MARPPAPNPDHVLFGFQVYRSGAGLTLACKQCPERLPMSYKTDLSALNELAEWHYAERHAVSAPSGFAARPAVQA